jgi:predicted RNase H-like nuclease (RuvC/YqgF family)
MNAEKKYPIGAYAPGHYQNRCANCKEFFIGDKLARQCELCALRSVHQQLTKQVEEQSTRIKQLEEERDQLRSQLLDQTKGGTK